MSVDSEFERADHQGETESSCLVQAAKDLWWFEMTEASPGDPRSAKCQIKTLEKLSDILHYTYLAKGGAGVRGFENIKSFAETLDYSIGRLRVYDACVAKFRELLRGLE